MLLAATVSHTLTHPLPFVQIVDPKTGDEKPITVTVDDGIRPNANLSDLAKLKPVFKKNGTTTAGIDRSKTT